MAVVPIRVSIHLMDVIFASAFSGLLNLLANLLEHIRDHWPSAGMDLPNATVNVHLYFFYLGFMALFQVALLYSDEVGRIISIMVSDKAALFWQTLASFPGNGNLQLPPRGDQTHLEEAKAGNDQDLRNAWLV